MIAFRIEGKESVQPDGDQPIDVARPHPRSGLTALKRSPADAEPGFQPRGSPRISVGIVRRAVAWPGTRTSRLPLAQLSHSVIPNEVFGSDNSSLERIRRSRTAWRMVQSRANPSPRRISLLAGKRAGNLLFSAAAGRQGGRKVIDAQGLFYRIPCSREQGILMAERGKYVGDTEKPAAASPILDRAKGQAIPGTAAELSASEGAPHYFLGMIADTPPRRLMVHQLPVLPINDQWRREMDGCLCPRSALRFVNFLSRRRACASRQAALIPQASQ